MSRRITQRQLRNDELVPERARPFVPADAAIAAFRGSPRIRFKRFRKDVDAAVDQDATPRA